MVFEVVPPGSAISLPSALSISTYPGGRRRRLLDHKTKMGAGWRTLTLGNMPTVFPNDARPVQEPGGRLIRLQAHPAAGGQKKWRIYYDFPPSKKNKTIYTWVEILLWFSRVFLMPKKARKGEKWGECFLTNFPDQANASSRARTLRTGKDYSSRR